MQKKFLIPFIALLLCNVFVQAQHKKPKEKVELRKDSTLNQGVDKTGDEADTSVNKIVKGIGDKVNSKLENLLGDKKKITTLIIVANSDLGSLMALTDRLKKNRFVKSTEKSFTANRQAITVCHVCSSESLLDWLYKNISDEYDFTDVTEGKLCVKKKDAAHPKDVNGKEGG